jgi:hypothetical protein
MELRGHLLGLLVAPWRRSRPVELDPGWDAAADAQAEKPAGSSTSE